MTMAMTMGQGMSLATPDVCLTPAPPAPPIPTPYPNMGNNAMAVPAYFTIMINGMPQLNTGSMYAMSNGDEAGVNGGVTSGTIMGPGRPLMGSTVNFVGGMPIWLLTKQTLQNVNNAPGVTTVPSQNFVMVMR